MVENFDYNMKLGDAFPNLQGVELDVEEFDLPVRIYNTLKRCKVNTLHELLTYSCNEILEHKGARQRMDGLIDYIIWKLDNLNTE